MPIPASTRKAAWLLLFSVSLAGRSSSPEMSLKMPAFTDDDGNELKSSLSLEGAIFPQNQSWFGESKDNLGKTSTIGRGSSQARLEGQRRSVDSARPMARSAVCSPPPRARMRPAPTCRTTRPPTSPGRTPLSARGRAACRRAAWARRRRPSRTAASAIGRLGLPVLGRRQRQQAAGRLLIGPRKALEPRGIASSQRTGTRHAGSSSSPTTTRTPTPSSTGSTAIGHGDRAASAAASTTSSIRASNPVTE